MTAIALLRQARQHVPPDLQSKIDAALDAEASDVHAIAAVGHAAWLTLTPRQQDLIRAIGSYQREHNVNPTMQELADAMGVSKVTVFEKVNSCILKGVLRKTKHVNRGLELVKA